MKNKEKNSGDSPIKGARFTSNTCYSSNIQSDCEGTCNKLLKYPNLKLNFNEFGSNIGIYKHLSLKRENLVEEDFEMDEREQYQLTIKMLIKKMANMDEEI